MGYFDLETINTAIESTLAEATGLKRAQDLDKLTETIPDMDLPLLQVVPTSWTGAANSQSNVNTFAGKGTNTVPIKQKQWVFDVFVFIAPVGQRFGETMVKLAKIAAALTEVIDAQAEQDLLFGEEAIRSFQYSATRGVIEYSKVEYNGFQITLTLEVW